ncbi:MAG TPA: cation:proton antiporter [Paludibacteraceae bacterium]|nr:cation:proton antiporter [Paludibacteraceae bacterium]HOS37233.1 cation:proton antiporter [Paludibacteraceae bacterium]HPK20881.1 cation:proton antiporter [Paludibacteraceae bacterium]
MIADWQTLPLTNPIAIFLLVLLVILGAPFLNKLKIPHIVGLILAGVLLGPFGLHVLENDKSFELFGKVGILYIMFLAGLEIDLNTLKKNSTKGIIFGAYTFLIPMVLGTLTSFYLLHFNWTTSILLASMYASHTLIAYPIVSRMGISRSRSISITVSGTIITVTLALLILAIIVALESSQINTAFWIRLGVSYCIFVFVLFFLFPKIARFFLTRYSDSILQYIFVLALVFAASLLAQVLGIEGVLGAFFAGLILNRLIPNVSPLMNRIEFIGNAIFIPFFLISIGMMVDIRSFFVGFETLLVAVVMSVVATVAKWLAAFVTQKQCHLSSTEGNLIFGLSNGQAAATLAAVTIGYNIGLFNDAVLNGTIVMILVTCAISSIVTERAARKLAVEEAKTEKSFRSDLPERILIPISNPETMPQLVEIGNLIKRPNNVKALFALNIEAMNDENVVGGKLLENACKLAAATDNEMVAIQKNDMNVANSILETMSEQNISDLVMGVHAINNVYSPTIEHIIAKSNENIILCGTPQPLNKVKRLVVVVPSNAELEEGFELWFERVKNFITQLGGKLLFFADKSTTEALKTLCASYKTLNVKFSELEHWEDFLILTKDVKKNDALAIVLARRATLSYQPLMGKVPYYINKYFANNNFMLIFPKQSNSYETTGKLFNPLYFK